VSREATKTFEVQLYALGFGLKIHIVQFRAATNADRAAVEKLVFGVLREYGLKPDPETTDADLRDITGFYASFDVLVDDAGEIVGTVGLRRENETECELRKMYLARETRGQGWGKRLLDRAMEQARARGFKRMTLETASVLREAIALYERNGFRRYTPKHSVAARCDATYFRDL
jgi:putative acetyltransferase